MWESRYINELKEKQIKAKAGGGPKRVEAQHSKGKLTVMVIFLCKDLLRG